MYNRTSNMPRLVTRDQNWWQDNLEMLTKEVMVKLQWLSQWWLSAYEGYSSNNRIISYPWCVVDDDYDDDDLEKSYKSYTHWKQ